MLMNVKIISPLDGKTCAILGNKRARDEESETRS